MSKIFVVRELKKFFELSCRGWIEKDSCYDGRLYEEQNENWGADNLLDNVLEESDLKKYCGYFDVTKKELEDVLYWLTDPPYNWQNEYYEVESEWDSCHVDNGSVDYKKSLIEQIPFDITTEYTKKETDPDDEEEWEKTKETYIFSAEEVKDMDFDYYFGDEEEESEQVG